MRRHFISYLKVFQAAWHSKMQAQNIMVRQFFKTAFPVADRFAERVSFEDRSNSRTIDAGGGRADVGCTGSVDRSTVYG